MTIASDVHAAVAPSGRADRIGRGLAAFASLATVGAFADGIIRMTDAADDRLWAEAWRTITYAFFIGLFALLAARPRQAAGIWELVLAGKTALVVVVALAYVLSRGWQAWQPGTTDPTRRDTAVASGGQTSLPAPVLQPPVTG